MEAAGTPSLSAEEENVRLATKGGTRANKDQGGGRTGGEKVEETLHGVERFKGE